MIKLITILGARPQFIKAAAVSAAIRSSYSDKISEFILHTGQHFDENMADVFFEELGLPQPHFRLHSASHQKEVHTGEMIDAIAAILKSESPDVVMVYGDTTSTMAGAVAASGLKIPLIHVEAGLRSFNKAMPEELNRIICDQLSTLLFTPTSQGVKNLNLEGIRHQENLPVSLNNPGVFVCGDVMYDVAELFKTKVSNLTWNDVGLVEPKRRWVLCTIHREQNTTNPDNLKRVLDAILALPEALDCDVVWPVHPRTRRAMEMLPDQALCTQLADHPSIQMCEPLSYLKTQYLIRCCAVVLTDSGGLQKEAFFAGKPSVIMRDETEWVELITNDYAILCGTDRMRMTEAIHRQWNKDMSDRPSFYGDGHGADFIINKILSYFGE